jgi:ABC-type nitrate/sulfonate/bicarbonate transport system permease component
MTERQSAPLRIQLVTLAAILAVYELFVRSHLFYAGALPPLSDVASGIWHELVRPAFYSNLGITAYEVAAGFVVATALGVGAGIVLGAQQTLGAICAPFIDAFATSPKIIYLPVIMLIVGTGPPSKVWMAVLSALFPIVISVAAEMREINPMFIDVAHAFRCSSLQMATKIYIPALMPSIVGGMRLGLGLSILTVLLGEIKIGDKGLGYLTIDAYNGYRMPEMYALLLLIFTIAVVTNMVIGRVTKH